MGIFDETFAIVNQFYEENHFSHCYKLCAPHMPLFHFHLLYYSQKNLHSTPHIHSRSYKALLLSNIHD